MDLGAVKAELADRLNNVTNVRAYAEWPNQPAIPTGGCAACISSADEYIVPHLTFGTTHAMTVSLVVSLIVGTTQGLDRSQQLLDTLVAEDIVDALYDTDRTLGGLVESVFVPSISGLKTFPIGNVTYVGHELSLELTTRHS